MNADLDCIALDRFADDGCPNFPDDARDASHLGWLADPVTVEVGVDIVPLLIDKEEVA